MWGELPPFIPESGSNTDVIHGQVINVDSIDLTQLLYNYLINVTKIIPSRRIGFYENESLETIAKN